MRSDHFRRCASPPFRPSHARRHNAPSLPNEAIGESHYVEVSARCESKADRRGRQRMKSPDWRQARLLTDLGFRRHTRDLRVVLRPSKKQKFRLHTPIDYIDEHAESHGQVQRHSVSHQPSVASEFG